MEQLQIRKYITGLLLLLAMQANGQYIIKEADHQFALYNYRKAIILYLQAYEKKPTLHAAEGVAASYQLINDFGHAERWYAIITNMNNSTLEDVLYYARALQSNAHYEEAKVQYQKYAAMAPDITKEQQQVWEASCDSAIKWMRNPVNVRVENLVAVNSPQSDWGAVTYQKGMVLTSDRNLPQVPAPKKNKSLLHFDVMNPLDETVYGWTGNKYLRLFYQYSKDSAVLFPFNAGTQYHIGAASFTEDERQVYFTLTRIPDNISKVKGILKTINVEIYSSKKNDTGKWMPPTPFTYNNVNEYSVGDPFITTTGDTLYFSSNMPGGSGGTDLYRCIRTAAGWSQPQNLAWLNTPGNERCPVEDKKGNLYFSSDGGIGMGGLDIYQGSYTGAGATINMGYPVNSPQDDFSFTLDANGNIQYLSSNRTGGRGADDIYELYPFTPPVRPTIVKRARAAVNRTQELPQAPNPPKVPTAPQPAGIPVFAVEGIVYDMQTKLPLKGVEMKLFKNSLAGLTVKTNDTGYYRFDLETATAYTLHGEKDYYMWDEKKISTNGLSAATTLQQNLYLPLFPMAPSLHVLNVYFDFNKWDILPEGMQELDDLVKLLKDHPAMEIELRTHTDSQGNNTYNGKLSQKRAESVARYLVTKGIEKRRLTAKGYGETKLLNRCSNGVDCSKEDHLVNRRTEFQILKY